jgi:hypothetical protein
MPEKNDITGSVKESSYMKPRLVGKQEKIDMNKDGKITKEDFSMLRAKMAMPKKDSPMNFKAMDYEMAKAMDYNQGKPMMYGDMPKMDHGAKMYKPKAYHNKK